MSSYFKEHNKTIDLGKKLAFMIPCYYIMIFSSQALHRILGNGLIVSDNMIMLSSISDFMLGVVCFFMARYILKAILIIEPEPTEEQIPS